MCLDRKVDFKVKLNKRGVGLGWKVFRVTKKGLVGEYYRGDISRPINRWLEAKQFDFMRITPRQLYCDVTLEKYNAGFHVYLTRKEARKHIRNLGVNYQIRQVKFRKMITTGLQNMYRIIVAQEILITNIKGN